MIKSRFESKFFKTAFLFFLLNNLLETNVFLTYHFKAVSTDIFSQTAN